MHGLQARVMMRKQGKLKKREKGFLLYKHLCKPPLSAYTMTLASFALYLLIQRIKNFGGDRHSQKIFIFPDRNSLYFSRNTLGLEFHLNKALQACPSLGYLLQNKEIEIIFEQATKPSRDAYIQFQMEQILSRGIPPNYVDKMRNALQVWEFSPSSAEYLRSNLNITQTYYIPMMLTYSAADVQLATKMYSFEEIMQMESGRLNVVTYLNGSYTSWEYNQGDRLFHSNGMVSGGKSLSMYSTVRNITTFEEEIDVLMFGLLRGSHGNLREIVCDTLAKSGINTLCLHQVFGETLRYFIQRSKIILNVEYYKNSSLATHRIDPLILAGKIVVSFPSSDRHLDEIYYPLIQFTSYETLVRDISIILKNQKGITKKLKRSSTQNYIAENLANVKSLCTALSNIQ